MKNKKIVISCGPIPARLDSVKFITNRFKGGLAFSTAQSIYTSLTSSNYLEKLTIVQWIHTPTPINILELAEKDSKIEIVKVKDVFEYFDWYKKNALNNDVFIMAAAVANLTPSNPYEGKFPSHNYKVGEKFNIEFEIAPRAIDIIKNLNPRATLIGYKLFDAKTDEELIEIARHTLDDSQANLVFANTPKTAKEKKIAVTRDGAIIPCSFQEHIDLILELINSSFFKTATIELTEKEKEIIEPYFEIVKHYEKTFEKYGTIAIRVPKLNGIVTTSRGHKNGPVYVKSVDFENLIVYANNKATLNAPLLFNLLNFKNGKQFKYDYVIHRHKNDSHDIFEYSFPGTDKEVNCAIAATILGLSKFNIMYHGYLDCKKFATVNWDKYYDLFPPKYFSVPYEIKEQISKISPDKILDVGANKKPSGNYVIDPYVDVPNVINLDYSDLKENMFDLIVIKNAINYLNKKQIATLKKSLTNNGIFIANTFLNPPKVKVSDIEVSFLENNQINHFLMIEDTIYKHSFYFYNTKFYENNNFEIIPYLEQDGVVKSAIVKYTKK